MDMKIHGFRVFQRSNDIYYIDFSRKQRRSLKTKDKKTAVKRAELAIEKYFQKKIISIKKAKQKILSDYLEEFLIEKSFDSYSSERSYRTAIKVFIDLMGDKSLKLITEMDINKFKTLHQQKNKVTKITINTYLVRIKALLRQAKDNGIIPSVPKISMFKIPHRLPVILEKDDKAKILEYIKATDYKFYQICVFALFTGCRRREILSAKWEDFKGFTINVIGKGNKERTVPLVPQAKSAMGEPKKKGAVFWQAHPDTYSHYFKKYARACDIHGVSFHKMRHTAATNMLEAGVNINVVQKVLGHTDLSTTKIYAHVMEQFLMDEMAKFGKI